MRHLAAFLLMLAASGALAHTADELAAKNAAAKGSPDELAALKSVRLSGKLRVNRGTLELRYVALIRRPDSIRYEVRSEERRVGKEWRWVWWAEDGNKEREM